ncbi:type I methionyl aminopeptidase [soil metagenome]
MSDKTSEKITAMREGGKRLGKVRDELVSFTQIGMSFAEIEAEAQRLIAAAGAKPNFAMVPDYHWATCIMKNDEMCHGIPSKDKKVEDGDLMTIDVGLLYQGYHLDTTTSFIVGTQDANKVEFLAVAKHALAKAIAKATPGTSIYEISFAMEKVIEKHGWEMTFQLTGHSIGKELHMPPYVPCIAQRSDKKIKVFPGMTLAIEVMAAQGDAELSIDSDGWTYRTKDGSLTVMEEETVLITEKGPEILTKA